MIDWHEGDQNLLFGAEHLLKKLAEFGDIVKGFLPVSRVFPIERKVTPKHSDFISDEITSSGTISPLCFFEARRAATQVRQLADQPGADHPVTTLTWVLW